MYKTDDLRIKEIRELSPPEDVRKEFPLTEQAAQVTYETRQGVHRVLHGADDHVVPPSQAELIVEALRRNGVPHAYKLYEGEGHGFRRSENQIDARNAELSFYAQILGFEPAGDVPVVPIDRG